MRAGAIAGVEFRDETCAHPSVSAGSVLVAVEKDPASMPRRDSLSVL